MDPSVVFTEHVEEGQSMVRVLVPSSDSMYRFPPENWALIRLFDGRRSYEEIAKLHSLNSGVQHKAEEIREFAASLEAMDFWYKTPQEKNVLLMQKSSEERQRLLKSKKSRYGDLAQILFPAVNPDPFLTWLYKYTRFVYSWWFTVLTLTAFSIMAGITITHWSEIGRDTLQFFNFTDKSWGDFAVFYLLALGTMCCHEIAHGHACKHYGGRVPSMGFMLIYLTPAFYTDTGEGFVRGSRSQRLVIAMAGAWAELIICAIATPIWWGTPPDSAVHDAAYLLMLMTGIASLLINWNPLMKLDGYYMLCEIIGIADLKEASTAYVSAWVKHHIWGLPIAVPFVPKRRRPGFVIYALLSGLYSYTVLYVVARFVGNVFRNFNPDWSFIPELATAALIFRSRIRTLGNFMKFVYLDKKDRVRAWFASRGFVIIAGLAVLLLLLPLWHESAAGRFVLEPAERVVVRNLEPGIVTDVSAEEGMSVVSGTPLIRLRNLPLQSKLAQAEAEYAMASMRATTAALQYVSFGPAAEERDRLAQQTRELRSQVANLLVNSPISGVVLTPRMSDRLGAYVPQGTDLVEVADLTRMRARIYVSEHDVYKIRIGADARLQIEGFVRQWNTQALNIAPVSSEIEPGLTESNKYHGLQGPKFYLVDLVVANPDSRLMPGMSGLARIYNRRRSAAALVWHGIVRFLARKVW
jgi:putative peptide zinc metalloprotease protein